MTNDIPGWGLAAHKSIITIRYKARKMTRQIKICKQENHRCVLIGNNTNMSRASCSLNKGKSAVLEKTKH